MGRAVFPQIARRGGVREILLAATGCSNWVSIGWFGQ